jgi:Ca2+-transporting ATPase
MNDNNFGITGLSTEQVALSKAKYGYSRIAAKKQNYVFDVLKSLVKEPMVLILLVASTIYFIAGDVGDGIFLSCAIVLVSVIAIYQDSRSKNALEKLKKFSQPSSKVIRNGQIQPIATDELVIGDSLVVEEGTAITADGLIVHANDFSVNESLLTGESVSVFKNDTDKLIYQGTAVVSGLAVATVTAIGSQTKLGQIGTTLSAIEVEKTPLELQINSFVKKMVIAGGVVFLVVWVINFFLSYSLLGSLLKALTMAMSILPEEIPVAYTTFMALGAWRLMKMGIVVKQMKTVETLGSATVICTDKTGTITENNMTLAKLFTLEGGDIVDAANTLNSGEQSLVKLAMWASEPHPFDPMEISLHKAYEHLGVPDERGQYKMIHEYPLAGKPPMMTHIFNDDKGHSIIAAKGAPEALMAVCNLSDTERQSITNAVQNLSAESYRVLAVGEAVFNGTNFPEHQTEFQFDFKGLVGFYDPPKKNIQAVFDSFYKAGIDVKIITGDNAATTTAIAKQVGFKDYNKNVSGEELLKLNEKDMGEKVKNTNIFVRMFPDAKLKVINILKAQNQIVAMTGDGVNDGPALKAAHIGIAMGSKGTEIAKDAASLVLLNDDLSKMIEAVAMGRRIYTNLKKAIRYVISIHIPIILTVFFPLALGWIYPNILSPVHVIFLELIMGPTCSIIYENEPMEKNTMLEKPRPFANTFFSTNELLTSVIQGLMITAGVLFCYRYSVDQNYSETLTRTMVFTTLISANIVLTLVNRSFYYSVISTISYKNNLVPAIIGATIAIAALLLYLTPLTRFFEFETPNVSQLTISVITGCLSVIWYELVKWVKRIKSKPIPENATHS